MPALAPPASFPKNNSLSVCFFSPGSYHFFNPGVVHPFGGAELQLYLLATVLAEDPAFAVSFVVGDFGQPRKETLQGVKLYPFQTDKAGPRAARIAGYYLRLWRLLKAIDAQVYIQRTAGVQTFAIALFCKLFRRKFVYMVAHDEDLSVSAPSWYGRGALSRMGWRLFSRGMRMADRVVVQHEGQREELSGSFGKAGVVRLSAHHIPEEGAPDERSFSLWVARCERWKQPGAFLDLARALPKMQFVMICPPSQEKEFFESVRRQALQLPNLTFCEYVPHREMEAYFRRAKFFVNTSRKEGFPNTFVEAARVGTPVLSLSVDPDGVLEEHSFGRVFGGDAARLAQGLTDLYEDSGEWLRLSGNAYAYASRRHNIRVAIEDDKKLLLSLV